MPCCFRQTFTDLFFGSYITSMTRSSHATISLSNSIRSLPAANVNNEKDHQRQEQGRPSADPEATVVNKGSHIVTALDGTQPEQTITYSPLRYPFYIALLPLALAAAPRKPFVPYPRRKTLDR